MDCNSLKDVIKQMHLNNLRTLNDELNKKLHHIIPLLQSILKEKERYLEDIGNLIGFDIIEVPKEIREWLKIYKAVQKLQPDIKQAVTISSLSKPIVSPLLSPKKPTKEPNELKPKRSMPQTKEKLKRDNTLSSLIDEIQKKKRVLSPVVIKNTIENNSEVKQDLDTSKIENKQSKISEELQKIKEKIEHRDSEEDSSEFEIIQKTSLLPKRSKRVEKDKMSDCIKVEKKEKVEDPMKENDILNVSMKYGTLLDDEVIVPEFPSQTIQPSQATSKLNFGFESGQ